jgi:hypothetical protein
MKPEEVVEAAFSTIDDPNPHLLGTPDNLVRPQVISKYVCKQQHCELRSWENGQKNQA